MLKRSFLFCCLALIAGGGNLCAITDLDTLKGLRETEANSQSKNLKCLALKAPGIATHYLFHKAFIKRHKAFIFDKIESGRERLLSRLDRAVDNNDVDDLKVFLEQDHLFIRSGYSFYTLFKELFLPFTLSAAAKLGTDVFLRDKIVPNHIPNEYPVHYELEGRDPIDYTKTESFNEECLDLRLPYEGTVDFIQAVTAIVYGFKTGGWWWMLRRGFSYPIAAVAQELLQMCGCKMTGRCLARFIIHAGLVKDFNDFCRKMWVDHAMSNVNEFHDLVKNYTIAYDGDSRERLEETQASLREFISKAHENYSVMRHLIV